METQKDLQELLILASQQSLKIAELQDQISQLQLNLQQKDSQLVEATTTIEMQKKQISDLSILQSQIKQLQSRLRESVTKISAIQYDHEKVLRIQQMSWNQEKTELLKQLNKPNSNTMKDSDTYGTWLSIKFLILYTIIIIAITSLLLWRQEEMHMKMNKSQEFKVEICVIDKNGNLIRYLEGHHPKLSFPSSVCRYKTRIVGK